MNHIQFTNQIDRIIEVYGDKYYPTPRVELIYKWASKLNEEELSAIVSKLIAECERPPMLEKFKDAYFSLGIVKPSAVNECPYCSGGGLILDDSFPGTAYRCRCAVGDRMPAYIARWTKMLVRQVPTKSDLEWRQSRQIITDHYQSK